jgi:hypothetical protein
VTPQLVDAYKKLDGKKDRKIEIVHVNYDANQKGLEKYLKKSKINFPALKLSETKTSALATIHPTKYLPTVVLANANGKVISTDLSAALAKLKELSK